MDFALPCESISSYQPFIGFERRSIRVGAFFHVVLRDLILWRSGVLQGLKATLILIAFAARLKACPFKTKPQ
jgi:hypothetical protein